MRIWLCAHLAGESDEAGLMPLPKTFNVYMVYPMPAGALSWTSHHAEGMQARKGSIPCLMGGHPCGWQ